METRLMSQIINCKAQASKLMSSARILYKKLHTKVPTKEIHIPVKYGHIAAKLWGNSNNRPILALHGWQDNAGTWDPLAPMIVNQDRSILAIDFPGHGLSSWIPPDTMYYQWELPRIILYLKKYFNWDKVSLLTHSLGASAGVRYACLYPNDVDFYIGLDSFIYQDYDLNLIVKDFPERLEKGLLAQERLDQEPPLYTKEEIENIWHRHTDKALALENVQYLAERGTKQSKQDPTKYFFSRDPRQKYMLFNLESKQLVKLLLKRLKSPSLYIKAKVSPYSVDAFSMEMFEYVVQNNKDFVLHFVPGTHYVHLNNPEVVAPLILNFLDKYGTKQAL